MATIEKYQITKLNGENYFNWRFRIEMLLKEKDLWKCISEDTPLQLTDAWKKTDEKAFATIVLAIEDSQLQHVRSCKTSKDAWNSLRDFHEKDSPGSRVRILRKIMNQNIDENGDIEEHVNSMNELFQKLLALNGEIKPEFFMSATLLASLPSSYDSLITALEARKEDDLTASFVRSKIIEEYRRRKVRDSNNSGSTSVLKISTYKDNNGNKKTVKCKFCKKQGHIRKDCKKFKDWLIAKNANNNANMVEQYCDLNQEVLFTVGKIDGWILDSGASCHISCRKEYFVSLDTNHHEAISLADGSEVEASGRGIIIIHFINDVGVCTEVKISDVLYIPSISANIISVKRLTINGFTVNFKHNKCEIIMAQNKQVAVGYLNNNIFEMRIKQFVNFVQDNSKKCIHDWHRILGHRDLEVIKALSNGDLIEGYKVVSCNEKCKSMKNCEICIKGKMSRLAFPKKSFNRSSEVLDLVHSDLCGPMQTLTPGGKKYMLTFIDDYSRYTVIYLLEDKSKTFHKFKEFYELTRNLFNKSIKILRTDRGGEYMGKDFKNFLRNNGIQSQYTAPYSPQQNGVAERKNRTLIEMARCLLFDSQMPNKYWGEAVVTANFLQNLLPWKNVNRTPFELWYNRKPIYSNLRRFGCKCFIRIQEAHRRKLDPKAEAAILLGFDMESKAYRCYVPDKQKVIISRDVKFCDDDNSVKASNIVDKNISNKCIKESFVEIEIPLDNVLIEDDNVNCDQNSVIEDVNSHQINTSGNNISDGNIIKTNDDSDNRRISNRQNKGTPPNRYIEEINLVQQLNWLILEGEPTTYNQAIKSDQKEDWIHAMESEIKSLHDNNTWELVKLPSDRKAIGCRWVYKIKTDSNKGIKFKARLVAQGYNQKFGKDYVEVFAPVARQSSLKMLLSIAANKNMIVHHFDAKTAFLNGDLKEVIYMKQPPGYVVEGKENYVCLLKKCLYGLKQAARVWNQKLHSIIINMGLRQSSYDPCLYTYISDKNNQNLVYIIVYVDDILVASSSLRLTSHIENELKRYFLINNLGEVNNYLGIRFNKSGQNYYLDQEKYINSIVNEFGLSEAKSSDTPMDVSYLKDDSSDLLPNNENYRKAIGSLLYVTINTRPDISAAVMILAQRVEQPKQRDWLEIKRVIKYLKNTANLKLKLGFTNEESDLIGFCDADWGEDRQTRKSNSGFVFFLGDPISRTCRKQTCVAQSSTEAEFIALAEASKECMWLRNVLADFYLPMRKPTVIFEDNQSCIKMVQNEKFNMRTKHIDIKAYHIKDNIKNGIILIEYCQSENNIADLLTKPLPKSKFNILKSKFGLV